MELNKIKKVHIIGIGGCASSAIAELLVKKGIIVTGSEVKKRSDLSYLEKNGIKINYFHDKDNLNLNSIRPDFVLYSPAVSALNPDNPELVESKKQNIPLQTWEEFIGDYLNNLGKIGITTCGSEGKGTTAGVLTTILQKTEWDPLSILGAKIKKADGKNNSNIYQGEGKSYILEADEYNRNFLSYHPEISIMINFKYEHPETYRDFNEYQESFYNFFKGMSSRKILIFRSTKEIIEFVDKYELEKSHSIIWFGDRAFENSNNNYIIKDHKLDEKGSTFTLVSANTVIDIILPVLPGYMIYNAAGAILAALELGLSIDEVKKNILRFKGMVRRFDLFKTGNNGVIITDYGHSPESVNQIIKEIRDIYKNKKVHIIFQPHLFSRTYIFFNEFVRELKEADRVSLIDVYPARENPVLWEGKISSYMIYEKLKKMKKDVFYAGKSSDIYNSLKTKIDEKEVTCFVGAGDMDQYYYKLFDFFHAENC